MKPEDIARNLHKSQLGQATGQAHTAVDRVYQKLTRPDRPIEPETHKQPWLAALLSFFIIGAGQLYNRQLLKAIFFFLLFYIVGGALIVVYLLLFWLWEAARPILTDLVYVYKFVWIGLWLLNLVDAYRTAWLLKTGKMVIRYGFLRQGLYGAASTIPVAGALMPSEIIAPDEVNKSVGEVAVDLAKKKVIEWFLVRLLRFGCLGLGALLVILGIVFEIHFLLTLGSLVILVGVALFLK